MRLLPVVLIPNINQNILKKPFYKYALNDAFKIASSGEGQKIIIRPNE